MTRLSCTRIRIFSRLGAAITFRPALGAAAIKITSIIRDADDCDADDEEAMAMLSACPATQAAMTMEATP
jgi:hypothetical protein